MEIPWSILIELNALLHQSKLTPISPRVSGMMGRDGGGGGQDASSELCSGRACSEARDGPPKRNTPPLFPPVGKTIFSGTRRMLFEVSAGPPDSKAPQAPSLCLREFESSISEAVWILGRLALDPIRKNNVRWALARPETIDELPCIVAGLLLRPLPKQAPAIRLEFGFGASEATG